GRLDPRSLDVALVIDGDPPRRIPFAYSPTNGAFMTGRWGEPGTYILTPRFEELWRRGEPVRRPRSAHGFPDSLLIDYGDGLLVEARLRPGARDANPVEFTRVVIEAAWAARTGEW
ncbi:MAG: hypothetical protein ACP5G6_09035, partial [Conexivisphaera sp.]